MISLSFVTLFKALCSSRISSTAVVSRVQDKTRNLAGGPQATAILPCPLFQGEYLRRISQIGHLEASILRRITEGVEHYDLW